MAAVLAMLVLLLCRLYGARRAGGPGGRSGIE